MTPVYMTMVDTIMELNKIIYAPEFKKIICMDNVPSNLTIYNRFGYVENEIVLNDK